MRGGSFTEVDCNDIAMACSVAMEGGQAYMSQITLKMKVQIIIACIEINQFYYYDTIAG